MYASRLAKHTYTALAETPSFIGQCLHHNTMGFQHILHAECIEMGEEIVSGNGVLHFLNIARRCDHVLSVNNIAYLTYGEFVTLYGERAMDSFDAIGLAQTEPIVLLQADSITLNLCRYLRYQVDSFGTYRKWWYISHIATNL